MRKKKVVRTWVKYSSGVRQLLARFGTAESVGAIAAKFAAKASGRESVHVVVWKDALLYVLIRNDCGLYPLNHRALITVNAATGEVVTRGSESQYSFVRRGWGAFVRALVGQGVPVYSG